MTFVSFRQIKYLSRMLIASHINNDSDSGLAVKRAPSLPCFAEIGPFRRLCSAVHPLELPNDLCRENFETK
jgi:hypothetical protein